MVLGRAGANTIAKLQGKRVKPVLINDTCNRSGHGGGPQSPELNVVLVGADPAGADIDPIGVVGPIGREAHSDVVGPKGGVGRGHARRC